MQQRRAAQARERRRRTAGRRARLEAAKRRQALRAAAVVASRVDTAASTVARAGRAAVRDAAATETGASDERGRGDIVLFALLVASALGIGLAAYSRVAGRPSSLERFRLELVGVSVTCMLIAALVLAGIV